MAVRHFIRPFLEKAARLGCGLIHNHPFLDGNERIGTHAMLVFLDINGISLSYTDEELIAAILQVASGEMDDPGSVGMVKSACGIQLKSRHYTVSACFSAALGYAKSNPK